jgi:hypothetical protein
MDFTIRGARLRTCGEGVKESQIFQTIGWLRARASWILRGIRVASSPVVVVEIKAIKTLDA